MQGTQTLPGALPKESLQGAPVPGGILLPLAVPHPGTHSLISQFEAFPRGTEDSPVR